MKVKKVTINLFLSLFIISIIYITEASCSNPEVDANSRSIRNINSLRPDTMEVTSNIDKSNISIKDKKLRVNQRNKAYKKLQKFKLKNQNNQEDDLIDTDVDNETNDESGHQQTDSILYVSWFIFIPLVLLIFIMTILSIAGFLILILSSAGTHNHPHPSLSCNSPQLRDNLNRLSNEEILQILRYKQHMKKKVKKTSKSNYIPEPEPEGAIFKK